jgi:hypothetical protein
LPLLLNPGVAVRKASKALSATEGEYRSTLTAIQRLVAGLDQEEEYRAKRDPQVHQLVVAGIEGFLEDLREQAAAYEVRHGMRKEDDHAR